MWLFPESERLRSPNLNRGRKGHTATILVLHYAVDGDSSSNDPNAVFSANFKPRDWSDDCMDVARLFAKKSRKASAHFEIGRDGSKCQSVQLTDTAWHAGGGRLPHDGIGPLSKGVGWINHRSVGIECCNAGWAADKLRIPLDRRVKLAHPANPRRKLEWETYPHALLGTLGYVAAMLRLTVPTLRFVCGHEDVVNRNTLGKKYGGKVDPGPAFPWDAIDWQALGYRRVRYDFKRRAWV